MAAANATLRLLHNLPRVPVAAETVTTRGHFERLFADYATTRRGEGPPGARQVA